jgi:hypothetical protein
MDVQKTETKVPLTGPSGMGYPRGHRPPALHHLWEGHPRNGRKTVLGVAGPQGVEGLGMAGPCETLKSPWIPLAILASPLRPPNDPNPSDILVWPTTFVILSTFQIIFPRKKDTFKFEHNEHKRNENKADMGLF